MVSSTSQAQKRKIPMHPPPLSTSVPMCHAQPRTHKQQVAHHPTAGCGSRIQLLSRGFQPPFHSVNSASHAHAHSSVAGLIPASIGYGTWGATQSDPQSELFIGLLLGTNATVGIVVRSSCNHNKNLGRFCTIINHLAHRTQSP